MPCPLISLLQFLTCGTEGTVYVWDEKTVTERESIDIKTVADGTNSCCAWNVRIFSSVYLVRFEQLYYYHFQGKNVFVGMTTTDLLTGVDKKIVGQCSLDDLESCRQLFTFSLEVTSVDASENYVVAGGRYELLVEKHIIHLFTAHDFFKRGFDVSQWFEEVLHGNQKIRDH